MRVLLDAEAGARQDGLDLTLVPGAIAERVLVLTGVRDRFRIRSDRP